MSGLPVNLGAMDAVPPALRYRIRDALRLAPADGGALEGVALDRLARLHDEGEPWIGADPSLAEVGYWMIEARHAIELRRRGCMWLTQFPSVETAKRLANIALDEATPKPVREQAIWTLGDRQLRAMHPSTLWPGDAVQIADDALGKLADGMTTRGKVTSEHLAPALRHVQSELVAAVIAKAPGLWGDAIECFASPPLARVLLISIDELEARHRIRVLRLVGATLGEEAVPLLVSRAGDSTKGDQLEILLLALSLGGEPQLGRLEEALRTTGLVEAYRQRAKWHLAHRGVVPTVRGLRIARTTAVMPLAERAARCEQAADDLGVLTQYTRHAEAYLYTMWGWMVRGAADRGRARALAEAHPASQYLVRELYLEELARRGRVKLLCATAQTLQAADLGALQLAIWGRPLAALELAATARVQTAELVCAKALACYRTGRPDLMNRILAEDLPPSEISDDEAARQFPGPHEQWLIAHAPTHRPAISALAQGRDGVIGLARPAPFDADADRPTIVPRSAIDHHLGRHLSGATIYLAGEFREPDRDAITAAVARAGARLATGPYPDTDFYVRGASCPAQTIAQLERHGARRLRDGELEGG